MRAIFELRAENAKIKDWLAERGGFEPGAQGNNGTKKDEKPEI